MNSIHIILRPHELGALTLKLKNQSRVDDQIISYSPKLVLIIYILQRKDEYGMNNTLANLLHVGCFMIYKKRECEAHR